MNRLLVFLCFISGLCFSQNPYFERYSLEVGLPTSNIYSVFEDNNGLIWFATDTGLLLFDGYSFKNYTTDDGLSDNEIFRIFQDSQNRLWFLCLNGKICFYKDGMFYNENTTPFLKEASHEMMIVDFFEDKEKNIYILFRDGRISIVKKNGIEILQGEHRSSFALWNYNNQILLVNAKSIKKLNDDKKEALSKHNIQSRLFIRYSKKDEGVYFYSIKDRIFKFENGTSSFILKVDTEEIINLSLIDSTLYIGTRNGLFIKNKKNINHYFENEQISDVFKDSQGSMWVTTLNNGLKYIPNNSIKNHVFNKNNTSVSAIFKATDSSIWVSTSNGIYKRTSGLDYIKINDSKAFNFREIDGNIFEFSKELLISINNELIKIPIRINDIVKTKTHYIVATSSYLIKIDHKSFETSLKSPVDFEKALVDSVIYRKRINFLYPKNDTVYVGTSNGLFFLKEQTLVKIKATNNALESSIVNMLYDNNNGLTFATSMSKGIIIMNNNKVLCELSMKDGLNSNICNKILKIDTDSYLLASSKGLNLISKEKDGFSVKNSNTTLGLKTISVRDMVIINDTLQLATNVGLISFHKSILKENKKYVPKILINDIKINGIEEQTFDKLSYDQNNIDISYTGVSFSSYGDITYEYRLNSKGHWFTTNNRKVVFNSLPANDYTFSVRAIGPNMVKSEIKTISFKIKPPFWRTLPFIIVLGGVLLLTVLYFLKKRFIQQNQRFALEREALKATQAKTLLEKQKVELEQKVLRLQMNPHFIFNALNAIKGQYSIGDIKQANNYISKFSRLLRLILGSQQRFIPLNKEIEMLQLYIKLLQFRYQNVFEFSITVSKEVITDKIGIPPLLLQPIIENAIIHGIAPNIDVTGELKISFKIELKKLVCNVTDNGIGISTSKRNKKIIHHKSRGLKITRERIDLINDSEDSENFKIMELDGLVGTQVVIKLPIKKIW